MSRRRQKNTLLPKMIGIAILINAVLLPLLVHFGAFKAIHGTRLTPVRLVSLPPPPKRPPLKKPAAKRHTAKAKPRPSARTAAHQAAARGQHSNPNQPKLVASAPGTGASGPIIDNGGTGTPGQLPVSPPPPAATPPVADTPAPTPTQPSSSPPPAAAPPTPHEAVIIAAEPLSQPKPQLPDDLSYEDIHGDFAAVFTVNIDGTATAKMVSSTGSTRLDSLAMEAASRWTFRPATVDGRPVASFRRLRIEFYSL